MTAWTQIHAARAAAHAKHGDNSIEALHHADPRWLSILVEEVGEVAQAMSYDKGSTASLRAELVDVLAVASAWFDALDRDDDSDEAPAALAAAAAGGEQGERPVGCSCWPPNPVGVHGHACDLYADEPAAAQPAALALAELLAMPTWSIVIDVDGWRWRVDENGLWHALATRLGPRTAARLVNGFGPITAVTE